MNSILSRFLLLFLFGCPTLALAKSDPAMASREDVEQIMALSGLNHQFDQLPENIRMQLIQQPPPLPEVEAREFLGILLQAFDPEQMRKQIRNYLTEHYDRKQFAKYLRLLKKPLVKKMVELEIRSGTPEAQMQMMQQANVFMAKLPSKRIALLRSLDTATHSSRQLVEGNVRMFQTMTRAINSLLPAGQQMPAEQFETISRNIREQGLYPAQQQILLQMAWAYQEASDQDLKRYLKINQSKTGQALLQLMEEANLILFEQISRKISEQVRQKILQNRSA